jgi:MFS family permease
MVASSRAFPALRYPNYRRWFVGQIVSLLGTWMQTTAQAFLVFELTHSARFLGYVAFAAGVPSWLLMLYGGVVADRISKRTLLICTQTAMLLLAFGLAAITLSGLARPWHILLFAFLLGTANAFDAPARQAFAAELVDREDLTNAIALNSAMFNAAAAVGPAVAGLTYAAFGPGWCFVINGISFVAVIAALFSLKIPAKIPVPSGRSPTAELREGLAYVAAQPVILTLMLLVGAVTLFGFSFSTLAPAWAVHILHGDARTNGWLQSARGGGALVSALLLASAGRFRGKGRVLTVGSFLFPALLCAFALTRTLALSLLALAAAGAAALLVLNLANALVQTLVRDDVRGRVMSIYSLTFLGSMPIGGMLMGVLAEHLGEPLAIGGGAAALLACTGLAFVLTPALRTAS